MKFFYKIYTLSILVSSIFLVPAYASQSSEEDCCNVTVSSEVDHCARMNYKKSNETLVGAFDGLVNRTKDDYVADKKLGNELIDLIRSSHEAWIIYRDLNCKLEAFEIEESSPAYSTTINNCAVRMNGVRIKRLNGL